MWFRRHWLIGFPYGKGILTHNPSNQKNLGMRLISSIMKCCNHAWNQVLKLRKDICVQKRGEFYAEKSEVVMTIQPSIIKKTSQVLHWMVGRPRLKVAKWLTCGGMPSQGKGWSVFEVGSLVPEHDIQIDVWYYAHCIWCEYLCIYTTCCGVAVECIYLDTGSKLSALN